MKIAVLSGKGGTGKTTVATNLSYALAAAGKSVQLLDADAEEPNSHIFFDVAYEREESVGILTPAIDRERCTHCGKCAESCQFSAISLSKKHIMVFENLCHGCGVCSAVCPEKAIEEKTKEIGVLRFGRTVEGISFGEGVLNIGQASPVKVIRTLKKRARKDADVVIIDSPPGTSCPAVESVQGVDFALLVTEPTPFGLHDLRLAAKTVGELGIPFGVVINRHDGLYTKVEEYLETEGIPLLMIIPYDLNFARDYSNGRLFSKSSKACEERFLNLFEGIRRVAGC